MTQQLQMTKEEALMTKLTSFLNRWAEQIIVPMIKERMGRSNAELSTRLRERRNALNAAVQITDTEETMKTKSQASTGHRPASTPAIPLGRDTQVVAMLTTVQARLRAHSWSSEELGKIPSEDLAILAYEEIDRLQREFNSCELFLSYWRGLQRQKR